MQYVGRGLTPSKRGLGSRQDFLKLFPTNTKGNRTSSNLTCTGTDASEKAVSFRDRIGTASRCTDSKKGCRARPPPAPVVYGPRMELNRTLRTSRASGRSGCWPVRRAPNPT